MVERRSMVEQLREELLDDETSLCRALRRAVVLAHSLDNAPFKQWVEGELEGYGGGKPVPAYRCLSSPILATITNGVAIVKRQPLALDGFTPEMKDSLKTLYLRYPVGELEHLAAGGSEDLKEFWPGDLVRLAHQLLTSLADGAMLMEVYRPIPQHAIRGALEAVRNKLLQFVLELERWPTDAPLEPVHQRELAQHITNNIYGGQNAIASGSGFSQSVQMVSEGDLGSLRKALEDLGLPGEEVDAGVAAAEKDGTPGGGRLGPRVGKWCASLMEKALTGAVVGIGRAEAEAAIQVARQFYGL